MKLATFNANSIRSRLDIVLNWLAEHRPDLLALQETKVADEEFPADAFREAGWEVEVHGQKARNGVAFLSWAPLESVSRGFGDPDWPEDCRLIAGRLGEVTVINTYVPNGTEVGTDKFSYKLEWLERFGRWVGERFAPTDPVVWLGDINIAPTPDDVYNSKRHAGKVGHHPDEIAALARLTAWGWTDLFRKFTEGPKHYTFWDYRLPDPVKRNLGWRIDHVYATAALAERCTACEIDRAPRALPSPSDHTFVVATFA